MFSSVTCGLVSSGSGWEVISLFRQGFLQVFAMAVVFTPFQLYQATARLSVQNVMKVLCTTPQMIGIGHVIEENEGLRYKSFDKGLLHILLRLNAGHCKT